MLIVQFVNADRETEHFAAYKNILALDGFSFFAGHEFRFFQNNSLIVGDNGCEIIRAGTALQEYRQGSSAETGISAGLEKCFSIHLTKI